MLATGTRLGPYEVLSSLGVGGMGEVYRARDTKLRREIALKILPPLFAADPDRRARFTREAHVLASLNHPHIASIYGIEESEGVTALVLELVEGPTLAERIEALRAKGSELPIDEALAIAAQIADALDAAHEKGIVHRDLKPANIKLTDDGRVKVLDFGLAKALDAGSASLSPRQASGQAGERELSISPTMTAMASKLGVIVGTAAYMSPEQAKGKAVDKRADIWAFGCVLYEMLTGQRAFAGDDVTDFIVSVMTKEPDWTRLPASTPPRVVELLQRCLKKDPRERLRDIGDARMEIEEALRAPAAGRPSVGIAGWTPRRSATRFVTAAIVGTALAAAAIAAMVVNWRARPIESAATVALPLTRTTIDLPSNAQLALGTQIPQIGFDSNAIALSSDGRHLAYVGQASSGTMLYLRDIDGFDVHAVAGTEGAIHAFFAPDGRWLGFLTNDKVKKVALDGGAPITLADARVPGRATWTRDDTIYFSEDQGHRLNRLSANDRRAPVSIQLPTGLVIFSHALPDGQGVLATASGNGINQDYSDVVLVSPSGAAKVVIRSGYDARYVAPGYLLFGRGGNLLAVRFNAVTGEATGDPITIVSGATMESEFGVAHASASDTGAIAYIPGGDRSIGRLAWVDRQGRTEFLPIPPRVYGVVDLAPAGDRLAVQIGDVTDYILIYDVKRAVARKLATGAGSGWPVWSPDGRTLAHTTWGPTGPVSIQARPVDGSGPVEELVPASDDRPLTSSWSPDGRVVAVDFVVGGLNRGLVTRGGRLDRLPRTRFEQWGADFSPDGRWIAYASSEPGQYEVFVQSFPGGTTVHQISVDGGIEPVWCRCGELFYRKGGRWMSAKIRTQPDLQWDAPHVAFETDFIDTPGRSYDVSPDGKRLLVVKRAESDVRNRINLVTNWTEALNRTPRR